DLNVLRPIDFLLHGAKNGFPSLEEDYEDPEYDPDNREKLIDIWRKNMRNIDKFWKIWSEEYLLSLREKQTIFHRHPRVIAKEIPKVGQIVLVHDENLPRGSWKLGKIIHLHISTDKEVRSAVIQMPNGNHLNRPINLLYPLEIEEPTKSKTNDQSIQLQDTTKRNDEAKCESSKFSYSSTINPIKYAFFILSILALLPISHGSQISRKCSHQTQSILLYSPSCLSSGLLVKKTTEGQVCWETKRCLHGHLHEDGTCGPKCPCPIWASNCYHGELEEKMIQTKISTNLMSPSWICALTPDPKCDSTPQHTTITQIQLFDKRTFFVQNLQLIQKQITRKKCIKTTVPEPCKNSTCSEQNMKFCFNQTEELTYHIHDDEEIPIWAWGIVPLTYYGQKQDHS
ncbi:hypothetical protein Tcan_00522, partial [Toxocara canis]